VPEERERDPNEDRDNQQTHGPAKLIATFTPKVADRSL